MNSLRYWIVEGLASLAGVFIIMSIITFFTVTFERLEDNSIENKRLEEIVIVQERTINDLIKEQCVDEANSLARVDCAIEKRKRLYE